MNKGHHRPIINYPVYYGYGYDPYYYSDYYRNYREPSYVVIRDQPAAPEPTFGRHGTQIATIGISLLLSYLLWGRRA